MTMWYFEAKQLLDEALAHNTVDLHNGSELCVTKAGEYLIDFYDVEMEDAWQMAFDWVTEKEAETIKK